MLSSLDVTPPGYGRDNAFMPKKLTSSEQDLRAGRRLRATREAFGIGQAAFAAMINVERTALANWEGGRLPDVRAMARLFLKTGIPLEWIYLGLLRNVPYEVGEVLEARATELHAVVGSPVAEWPMAVERRPALQSLRVPGDVPPSRPRLSVVKETERERSEPPIQAHDPLRNNRRSK